MPRKLEKELSEKIEIHKYSIIASSLIDYEDEGIYNTDLLKDKYGDDKMKETGEERAFKVTRDLEKTADSETYNKIYEMCWQKAKHYIKDKLYGFDI